MRGFVPVTKASLLAMVEDCRLEIVHQVTVETDKQVNSWIKSEEKSSNTRRWFGLVNPPKARFSFDRASVIAFSKAFQYDMFDGCPIERILEDEKYSNLWLDKMEKLATSEHSGEPILLDIHTFNRLSRPETVWWASKSWSYSCPVD